MRKYNTKNISPLGHAVLQEKIKQKKIRTIKLLMEKILFEIVGDPTEGTKETPERYAKAIVELTTEHTFNFTTFDAKGYNNLILEKSIPFYSLCEHHLLPFFGFVSIGYLPAGKIVGISKLARTVEHFSKQLNTQEYFTENIATFLMEKLKPKALGVSVVGRHTCQEMRGIKKTGTMETTALRGLFLRDAKARMEFFYSLPNNPGEQI